ncbi:MAG: hydrogenase maturation nickel metallochaperone HypA [Endomicrobia bacterium]|nr:hydrogenase maturation nickel metallochaperone HypA [Endomicrobiia bacterium]
MHEYSLARDLAYIIFKHIKEKKAKKVNKIVITVGEASGIEKNFLEHSLKDHIFKNTICENAEIVFNLVRVKIKCKNCNNTYENAIMKCVCGSDNFEIVSGKDVYVEEIEVE